MLSVEVSSYSLLTTALHLLQVLRGSTNAGRADAALNRPSTKRSHSSSSARKGGGAYRALFRDADELSLAQFLSFAQALQEAVLTARFTAWDTDGSGALDGAEFARFLASAVSTDRALQSRLWERAESPAVLALGGSSSSSSASSSSSSSSCTVSSSSTASEAAAVSITLAEFLAFHEFLHCLDAMEAAMSVLGTEEGLTLPEFLHAARAAVSGHAAVTASGVAVGAAGLSEGVARVLFAVFDADGNGRLDKHEFVTVLRRQQAAEDPQRQLGVLEFLERVKDCALKELS
jgi:EF-hand domain pair